MNKNAPANQLLALNLEVAAKIERTEPVTPPGIPKHYPDARNLLTADCMVQSRLTANRSDRRFGPLTRVARSTSRSKLWTALAAAPHACG